MVGFETPVTADEKAAVAPPAAVKAFVMAVDKADPDTAVTAFVAAVVLVPGGNVIVKVTATCGVDASCLSSASFSDRRLPPVQLPPAAQAACTLCALPTAFFIPVAVVAQNELAPVDATAELTTVQFDMVICTLVVATAGCGAPPPGDGDGGAPVVQIGRAHV